MRSPARAMIRPVLAALLLVLTCAIPFGVRAAPPVQLWEEADLRLRPGVNATVIIRLSIAEGFAVVGAGVQHETLRPLQLRMQPAEGVRFGVPAYPRPQPVQLLAGRSGIPAHSGVVAIRLPVQVAANATWSTATLRGALRYQACRAGTCEAPQALPVAIELEAVRSPTPR